MKKTIFWAIILIVIFNMGKLSYPLDNQDKAILRSFLRDEVSDLVFESVWEDFFYYHTFFDSLDGWTATNATPSWQSVNLTTPASLNGEAQIAKQPVYQGTLSFNKKGKFKTAISLSSVTEVEMFVGIGTYSVDGYGFFINDNALYGNAADGSGNTQLQLATLSTSVTYGLRAEIFPHEKVLFYVDDVLKGTVSVNVPTGAFDNWANFDLITTNTSAKTVLISFFEYIQQKDR